MPRSDSLAAKGLRRHMTENEAMHTGNSPIRKTYALLIELIDAGVSAAAISRLYNRRTADPAQKWIRQHHAERAVKAHL